MKQLIVCSFRRENLFFGTARFHWLPQRHDICISQISVAADYSDSVPDSSSYVTRDGYHPLEELRDHGRVRDTMPTSAEIARNAVEVSLQYMLYLTQQINFFHYNTQKILEMHRCNWSLVRIICFIV